ncbi:MAG: hypothetical protein EAZ77_09900 [Nostocales cyanobacterium]|nr:MAG: hypothetical protein EAZ77_09900 [Nostocales cyanobacterium]
MTQNELSIKALGIIDAINRLEIAQVLFDIAEEQVSQAAPDESVVRCQLLLEAYKNRYSEGMAELRQAVEELSSEIKQPQRPALTLVG